MHYEYDPEEIGNTIIDDLQSEKSRLLERAAQISRRIKKLSSMPKDEYSVGCLLTFQKTYGNRIYDYAALKGQNGMWFLTGKISHGVTWEFLCTFMEGDVYLVTQVSKEFTI